MANFFRPSSYAVMVSPDLKHAWINIPKNASSFCQKVFDDNGWTMCHTDDLVDGILSANSIKKIVVLRDPVQRWISGFAQCMMDHNVDGILEILDKPAFWDTVFFNPIYDDHTEYQHRFIGNAENIKYIKIQDKGPKLQQQDTNRFYRDLSEYVRSTGGTSEFQFWKEPTNPADNDENKFAIYTKIHAILKERKDYQKKLRSLHIKDYTLFERFERFTTNENSTN